MGVVITVSNNKGGVAKTTVCTNLGNALARMGKKVLVVDVDAQCNSTDILLEGKETDFTLYDILDGSATVEQCIYQTPYENMWCLPNSVECNVLEMELISDLPDNWNLLKDRIGNYVRDNFDYIFVDCPPNMGYFVVSALLFADCVIVPVMCRSRHAIKGMTNALQLIRDIAENQNPNLKLLRILVAEIDKRLTVSKAVLASLVETYGEDNIFSTYISSNTDIQKAEHAGKTVLSYASESLGARCYRALAKEVLEITSTTLETVNG